MHLYHLASTFFCIFFLLIWIDWNGAISILFWLNNKSKNAGTLQQNSKNPTPTLSFSWESYTCLYFLLNCVFKWFVHLEFVWFVICILYFTGSLEVERPTCLAGGAFLVAGELWCSWPAYKWEWEPFPSQALLSLLLTHHDAIVNRHIRQKWVTIWVKFSSNIRFRLIIKHGKSCKCCLMSHLIDRITI